MGPLSGATDAYGYNGRNEVVSARRTLGGSPVAGFDEDFAYDPIGSRVSSTDYDETGAARTSLYAANALNQYTARTVPGWASVRGLAAADATVAVNGNAAYMTTGGPRTVAADEETAYFFGSDDFDNSAGGGFAELEVSAVVSDGTNDLVSVVTNRVFVPPANETYAYDADGNQTLVTTGTGEWQVEYNGENRPVRWACGDRTLLMDYDQMGRRRSYVEQKGNVVRKRHVFTYDGYLQIARSRVVDADFGAGDDAFLWDPTEPVVTRPLACSLATPQSLNSSTFFYALDGNKNVTELVGEDGEIAAHYEYSAFGKTLLSLSSGGHTDSLNPWRFSAEYAEDATWLVYYNYRHYELITGRWLVRDPLEEDEHPNLVVYVLNSPLVKVDYLGQQISMEKCNQLLDSLWNFTPSNMDIDILSMGISIEAWGCKNPKPTCVCAINGSNGSFHPGNNSIELNAYNLTESEFRGTLLHELQHRYDSCISGGNGPEDCHERTKWEVNAVLRSGKCKSAANSTTDWNCVKKRAKASVDKHSNCAATSSAEIDAYIKKLKLRGWL